MGALIDTACGSAAASVTGKVVTSQYRVRCFRPAICYYFIVRAQGVRCGKRRIFTTAELLARRDGEDTLFAGADAILIPMVASYCRKVRGFSETFWTSCCQRSLFEPLTVLLHQRLSVGELNGPSLGAS
jgi:hypothetical protein